MSGMEIWTLCFLRNLPSQKYARTSNTLTLFHGADVVFFEISSLCVPKRPEVKLFTRNLFNHLHAFHSF